MNEEKDILELARQEGNAFRTPEGYFDSLEDRVMARIAAETAQTPARRPVWSVLKPALTLAAMFALIFGMGYGVLSLTHTLGRDANVAATEYASAEEEMITPASLINYYQSDPGEETELDEDAIESYLASALSYSDLAEIYAQSY